MMAGWQPTAGAGPVLITVMLNPRPHDAPNGQSGQPSSRQLGLSGPKQTLRNSHPVLLGCHCVAGIVLRALSFKRCSIHPHFIREETEAQRVMLLGSSNLRIPTSQTHPPSKSLPY